MRYALVALLALFLLAAPALAGTTSEPPPAHDALGAALAFADAVNAGDAAAAAELFDPASLYGGLLICAPNPCAGRDAIFSALVDEVADRTEHLLHRGAARSGPGWAVLRGEARSMALANAGRLSYELRATAGPAGIVELRFLPDPEDPPTARVLADLARVGTAIDEWRSAGSDREPAITFRP